LQLEQWAICHGVSHAALHDLKINVFHHDTMEFEASAGMSENAVQQRVRLEAARLDILLFRNNVGVLPDDRGVPVRYGLANESPTQNKRLKSADLIGLRKVLITPAHVGHTIGQFVSREVKESGWRYTGVGREAAQQKWVELICKYGGDACFAAAEGTL